MSGIKWTASRLASSSHLSVSSGHLPFDVTRGWVNTLHPVANTEVHVLVLGPFSVAVGKALRGWSSSRVYRKQESMFVKYQQGAVVPFENQDIKQIVVTDNGTVAVYAECPDHGRWFVTANSDDQGPAGVTIDEMRARVETLRAAVTAKGLPKDNLTAFALAVVGLDSAGGHDFDANAFHRGVMGLSPHLVANVEKGTTTTYDPDGSRVNGVPLQRLPPEFTR